MMNSFFLSFGGIIAVFFVVLLVSLLLFTIKVPPTNKVLSWHKIEGIEKELENLGRKDVVFPILLYGGIWEEISFLGSIEELSAQSGTGAEYIVDSVNNQYIIHVFEVNDILESTTKPISLEEARFDKELPFGTIKDGIIADIRADGSLSGYEILLSELENTNSVEEIVLELKKGIW